jgi:hypothetical protein
LPDILDKLDAEAAADCTHSFMEKERNLTYAFGRVGVFVRGVAKSPTVVAAEHTDAPDGSRTWWVIYVGREPGLYTTMYVHFYSALHYLTL